MPVPIEPRSSERHVDRWSYGRGLVFRTHCVCSKPYPVIAQSSFGMEMNESDLHRIDTDSLR